MGVVKQTGLDVPQCVSLAQQDPSWNPARTPAVNLGQAALPCLVYKRGLRSKHCQDEQGESSHYFLTGLSTAAKQG